MEACEFDLVINRRRPVRFFFLRFSGVEVGARGEHVTRPRQGLAPQVTDDVLKRFRPGDQNVEPVLPRQLIDDGTD